MCAQVDLLAQPAAHDQTGTPANSRSSSAPVIICAETLAATAARAAERHPGSPGLCRPAQKRAAAAAARVKLEAASKKLAAAEVKLPEYDERPFYKVSTSVKYPVGQCVRHHGLNQ